MNDTNEIFVYENWKGKEPSLIGLLYSDDSRGKPIISFEYSDEWLENLNNNMVLDPDLFMYRGRQFVPADKNIFGMFSDSCPDRWGRLLMKRREAFLAKKEDRKPKKLSEIDFLLGVYDETRMGALRFSKSKGGSFLSDDKTLSVPPWTTLRTLESASLAFEKNEDGMEEKWLKQLVVPGSSLGGARPKASVMAPDGSLWIAKFPSGKDEINVGAWEMVVHDLAQKCNIDVPEAKLECFSKNGATYLSKRFDRKDKQRIHFASAMTLLGKVDGVNAADGIGYLDLVSVIRQNSVTPKNDLNKLWRRIVFNIAVSNTDDHLRNHGFLLDGDGWRLSPAYDINPNIYGDSLSLNIDSENNLMNFDLALSVASYFDIKQSQAEKEVSDIKLTVDTNWRMLAKYYDLSRGEIEEVSPAFNMTFKE